jgi:Leucine-rich repeat (LRR) protein
MPESTAPRRRWFRFRLRTLLVAVAILAVPIAWVAKERRQSKYELQIAEQLRERGFTGITLGGPYDSWELRGQDKPQGIWRNLARLALGDRVVSVGKPPPDFNDFMPLAGLTRLQLLDLTFVQISDLTSLAGLTNLQHLWLNLTQVSDLSPLAGLTNLQGLYLGRTQVNDLTPLAGLRNLKSLYARGTQVHDLTPLAGLINLQWLYLDKSQVSDLTPLAGLKKLTNVTVCGTRVTKEQIEALQTALPNCTIDHDPFP